MPENATPENPTPENAMPENAMPENATPENATLPGRPPTPKARRQSIALPALIALALFSQGAAGRAADRVLTLDPTATEVTFTLEATGHDVHGHLYLSDGELRLGDDGQASGSVRLDARQSDSGNEKRDRKMRDEVLEAASFPWIAFRAERYEGALASRGPSQVTIHGVVSLHGDDHPASLPVELEIVDDHFTGRGVLSVPYVAWGLPDPSILFLRVADTVTVEIAASGAVAKDGDEAAR